MKHKFYLALLLILTICTVAFGQNITGKVTDENGVVLPGVSIMIKGTNSGTTTNSNGSFQINAKSDQTLIFSFIGYIKQEVSIGSREVINVSLNSSQTQLDEVVVTALGITKDQKTLGYATQIVDSKNLATAKELNVANSLIGRVNSLEITKSGSGLGGSTRVVIRGDRSITGNNQALIVVDGVPMNNTSILGPNLNNQDLRTSTGQTGNIGTGNLQGGREYSDAFSSINPDDIESINVLKGASATALYGSRASNGALIITTKKGAVRKGIGVTVNSSFQAEEINRIWDFQNEYGQGAFSAASNAGVYNPASEFSWGPRLGGSPVATWSINPAAAGTTLPYEAQPNNVMDFYRSGYQMSNSVALSGGTEKGQSYFSYTNVRGQGILPNNALSRNIFNVRLNNKFGEKLTLDAKVTYLQEDIDNRTQTGFRSENPNRHIFRIPRNISTAEAMKYEFTDPISGRNRQNYWNANTGGGQNPYWALNNIVQEDLRQRLTGFSALTYKFNNNFSILGRGGIDAYWDKSEGKVSNDTYTLALNGDYNILSRDVKEYNLDLLAFYKQKFGKNLAIDVTGGYSFVRTLLNQTFIHSGDGTTGGLNLENVFTTGNYRVPAAPVQTFYSAEKQGLFLSSEFTFKDAITLSLTGRNDWSSTLPKESWSYFYPSAGVSVVLSNLINLPQQIDFLKVRSTLAQTGNDTYAYVINPTYTVSTGGVNGFLNRDNNKVSSNLRPERTNSFEFGFETKFLKNRFGLDFTYYNNTTVDQLFQIPVTLASGYNNLFTNGGNVQNFGFEVLLNMNLIRSKDFNWKMDINYSKNDNKLLELSEFLVAPVSATNPNARDPKFINMSNEIFMNNMRAVEGRPLGEMYVRGFVRNQDGAVLVGADGLPTTTSALSVYAGNTRANWVGGISNRFTYKGITLSALISARVGGIVTSYTSAVLHNDGVLKSTLEGRDGNLVVDGVLADGTKNTKAVSAFAYWQKIGNPSTTIGEAFIYDATNVRLRELTLGYSLPAGLLKKTPFQSVNVSLVGRNLFYFVINTPGFDPEVMTGITNGAVGIESFGQPSTRQLGVNLNLTF
jgi:TonB-linked SusC/RagA family outer membrane protein